MKKIIISLTFIGTFIVSMLVLPTSIVAEYGIAGCGWGSQVMGAKKAQLFASTTNQTFNIQYFAITSGTSNCTDDAALKAEVEQKVYAFQNYSNLEKEMAKGQGESVTSFAYLLGCSASSVPSFASVTKSKYDFIFTKNDSRNAELFLSRVKTVVSKNETLSKACARI